MKRPYGSSGDIERLAGSMLAKGASPKTVRNAMRRSALEAPALDADQALNLSPGCRIRPMCPQRPTASADPDVRAKRPGISYFAPPLLLSGRSVTMAGLLDARARRVRAGPTTP